MVSDILPFSLNDGPGIRTAVFLKGCPLHCPWCHNPETGRAQPQTLYASHRCIHCGECARVCPEHIRKSDGSWAGDSGLCTGCGACERVCPVQANRCIGREMTPEDLCRRVLPDKPFFRQRGGVTFSGGEPLMQAEFVRACAVRLKEEGISCAVETSLYAHFDQIAPLMPFVDIWLCDWKMTDPVRHLALTGADNTRIYQNLCALDEAGARLVLRCPLIPGCNDDDAHLKGIARLANQLTHIEKIDILPYHDIGNDKRMKLGLPGDGFSLPTAEDEQRWRECLMKMCDVPVRMRGGD